MPGWTATEIDLHTARSAIQHDWRAAYRKKVDVDPSSTPGGMAVEEEKVVEKQWLGRTTATNVIFG